jgi:hypothetical protein
VRGWDIDPVQGLALLWEINLPHPSGKSQAFPLLVPADVDGGVGDDLITISKPGSVELDRDDGTVTSDALAAGPRRVRRPRDPGRVGGRRNSGPLLHAPGSDRGPALRGGLHLPADGAAPGITGRLILSQVGTGPAAAGGTLSSLGAVSPGVQVSDLVTGGAPSDPRGSGHWSLRRRGSTDYAGRTLLFQVELDDAGAFGAQAETNQLFVHFGEELN